MISRFLIVILISLSLSQPSIAQKKFLSIGGRVGCIFYSSISGQDIDWKMNYMAGIYNGIHLSEHIELLAGVNYETKDFELTNIGNAFIKRQSFSYRYLSIPIDIKFNFFRVNQLLLYSTIGGIITKQLSAEVINFKSDGEIYSREFNDRCVKDQKFFYITLSFGIQYDIGENWGLGFEPEYRYAINDFSDNPCFLHNRHSATISIKFYYMYLNKSKVIDYLDE